MHAIRYLAIPGTGFLLQPVILTSLLSVCYRFSGITSWRLSENAVWSHVPPIFLYFFLRKAVFTSQQTTDGVLPRWDIMAAVLERRLCVLLYYNCGRYLVISPRWCRGPLETLVIILEAESYSSSASPVASDRVITKKYNVETVSNDVTITQNANFIDGVRYKQNESIINNLRQANNRKSRTWKDKMAITFLFLFGPLTLDKKKRNSSVLVVLYSWFYVNC